MAVADAKTIVEQFADLVLHLREPGIQGLLPLRFGSVFVAPGIVMALVKLVSHVLSERRRAGGQEIRGRGVAAPELPCRQSESPFPR